MSGILILVHHNLAIYNIPSKGELRVNICTVELKTNPSRLI